MKYLFVPYEIALRLKELGFDEPGLAFYSSTANADDNDFTQFFYAVTIERKNEDNNVIQNSFFTNIKSCVAPLYQQIIDWFDSRGIIIEMDFTNTESAYGFQFSIKEKGNYTECNDEECRHQCKTHYFFKQYYDTRYEAIEESIKEALKLIKP